MDFSGGVSPSTLSPTPVSLSPASLPMGQRKGTEQGGPTAAKPGVCGCPRHRDPRVLRTPEPETHGMASVTARRERGVGSRCSTPRVRAAGAAGSTRVPHSRGRGGRRSPRCGTTSGHETLHHVRPVPCHPWSHVPLSGWAGERSGPAQLASMTDAGSRQRWGPVGSPCGARP